MLIMLAICVAGLIAGFLLMRTVPLVPRSAYPKTDLAVTIIIPARDEELNLPSLLRSMTDSVDGPTQILVVDDGSTDATASVATRHGAQVLTSAPLPPGWTGKNWACHQGAQAATTEVLFFLDADTCFKAGGYDAVTRYFSELPRNAALSLLPFHRVSMWHEELSLFFNILMAMGAGGFGGLAASRLFGPSLLIRAELYHQAGGHQAVRRHILENFNFANCLSAAGADVRTLGGRDVLEMRMFPESLSQLRESWQKAFAAGAGATPPLVLGLSICWLAAAMLSFLLLFITHGNLWRMDAVLYVFYVCQIGWFARQLGSFRWQTVVTYPAALVFYFVVFGQSLRMRLGGKRPHWRGREV